MLTGRLLSEDKVSGLSLGADHYLTKPVNLAELGATLVSLSRRLRVVPAEADDAGGNTWRFDPARRTLVSPGQVCVDITDTESRLIGALIQAAPLPLSRGRLVEALGASIDAYDTHRLDAHMHRLRRKLRAQAAGDLGIRTVYGVGYVCTTPVQVVGSAKP
jgi:DNA-binding response OmpR family regulator